MSDHNNKSSKNPNPRKNAGYFSILTFMFTIPTFIKGLKKDFSEEDIYETLPEHRADQLGAVAAQLWSEELTKAKKLRKRPSLVKILFKLFGWQCFYLFIIVAVRELFLQLCLAVALGDMIDPNSNNTIVSATNLIILSFLHVFVYHPYGLEVFNVELKMQVVCSSLIYQKILKLHESVLRQTTTGKIINLLSNDIIVFERAVNSLAYLWIAPIQTAAILYLGYKEIGIACILGTCCVLMFLPIHFFCGKLTAKYHLQASLKRDECLRYMNEIIQGIEIIKMFVWEEPFKKVISWFRKLEIAAVKKTFYAKASLHFQTTLLSTSLFVSMVVAILFDINLNAKKVFIVTQLFTTLSNTFMIFVPSGIAAVQQLNVSLNRITDFLLSKEMRWYCLESTGANAISIKHATIKWNETKSENLFTNLTVSFKTGLLTAVIGPVGCGKSSLLKVILQELPLAKDSLEVSGTVSYASQESWMFSGTVQQNILFGTKMNRERYANVIKCCSLERDLNSFSHGDKTLVGEKGTFLSGGQKSRINLARTIYREADIYLLDDPLSSVDTNVGKQIFIECIRTFLKDKTVILITHQLQYLKCVDHVVAFREGILQIEGSPTELVKSGFDFASYLKDSTEEHEQVDLCESVKPLAVHQQSVGQSNIPNETTLRSKVALLSTYKEYIKACKSIWLVILTVFCFLGAQVLTSLSFYFIAYWVQIEREMAVNGYDTDRRTNIYVYCVITLATVFFSVLRLVTFVNLTIRSSINLHTSMVNSLLRAPINFFRANHSGSILNRFGKDLCTTDTVLPGVAMIGLRIILTAIGGLIVVCVVSPWFILPTICGVVIFLFIRKAYIPTNLNILRVESVTRSPIYGHANTSLQGLPTIRAFKVQKILTREFNTFLDSRSSAFYLSLSISRALAFWIDILFSIFTAIVIIYFVISKESTEENIGLAISQITQLSGQVAFGIKYLMDMESYMIPVERVIEYCRIQPERFLKICLPSQLPMSWPERGRIRFNSVFLKYSQNGPYVLKNLNFTVEPEEKIGIVGRTGAGKSSAISALFQFTEMEGMIEIDGVNIQTINLNDLRKNISIIPQDPVLFSGSLRQNLDPFWEYDDDLVWKALEDVGLKETIVKLKAGLNYEISQDGSNLSVGQKQLICLARAIIRNNKILILDEATANVDLQTDDIIQGTIRQKFSTCTVLTVAHRLKTIMDSDKVLVFNDGEIVEYDHPYTLLQNTNGSFYKMVQKSDQAMANVLTNIAKQVKLSDLFNDEVKYLFQSYDRKLENNIKYDV